MIILFFLFVYLYYGIVCRDEIECNGNGECTSTGNCSCFKDWNGDSCSSHSLFSSNCNLTSSIIPRIGGNWSHDGSIYQIYGIFIK